MKYLCLLLISLPAFGQFGAASRILSGTGAPVAAQCTVENNVGLVWARKDGADAGTTFYVCGATGVGTYGWELRGGAPGGGAALSTVGSVPFVTAAGVLGQSANLFWDNANGRLGVGTNAPAVPFHVARADTSQLLVSGTTRAFRVTTNSTEAVLAGVDQTGFASFQPLMIQATRLAFNNGAGEIARFAATSGNLLLGTTTDDGTNRLQVAGSVAVGGLSGANSSIAITRTGSGLSSLQLGAFNNKPTVIFNGTSGLAFETFSASLMNFSTGGTLALYNETPTTGSTSLVVRAGAGQSGNLTTWQNSGGSAIASISSGGDILARIHTWANGTEGTCDATLRGQVVMVQGGAGVADTFRVCRKDAANAYAWTALY